MVEWMVKERDGLDSRFRSKGVKASSALDFADGQIWTLESKVLELKVRHANLNKEVIFLDFKLSVSKFECSQAKGRLSSYQVELDEVWVA